MNRIFVSTRKTIIQNKRLFFSVFILLIICIASISLAIFYFVKNANAQNISTTVFNQNPSATQIQDETEVNNVFLLEQFNDSVSKYQELERKYIDLNEKYAMQNPVKPNEEKTKEKIAYLTFDDGPSKNTEKVLDILKENNIKGTFFVVANTSDFGKKMYKRIVDEGHTIAPHCYYHGYSSLYANKKAYTDDFEKINNIIKENTGVTSNIMRFPGGSNNTINKKYNSGRDIMPELIEYVHQKGYEYYDWNVSSLDSAAKLLSKEKIVNGVKNTLNKQPIAIVVMHDSSLKTTTVEALPEIIQFFKDDGYIFATITNETKKVQFRK